jgi:hypothetical protein
MTVVCLTKPRKLQSRHIARALKGELTAWKATLYDVMVGFMDLGDADRGKLADTVAEIKALVREIEAKTSQLESECPLEGVQAASKDLEDKIGQVRVHYSKALEVIGAGSFGG